MGAVKSTNLVKCQLANVLFCNFVVLWSLTDPVREQRQVDIRNSLLVNLLRKARHVCCHPSNMERHTALMLSGIAIIVNRELIELCMY